MPKSKSKTLSSRRSGRGIPIPTASANPARRPSLGRALPRDVSPRRRSQNPAPEMEPLILPVDRRHYNPEPELTRPARRVSGVPARVVAPPLKKRLSPAGKRLPALSPAALLFARPAGVAVCVQRGIRKEVLHAKNVAGKTGLKAPRRGPYSKVKC